MGCCLPPSQLFESVPYCGEHLFRHGTHVRPDQPTINRGKLENQRYRDPAEPVLGVRFDQHRAWKTEGINLGSQRHQ